MACHSPLDSATGELTGPAFSGNMNGEPTPDDPDIIIRAPNLTPDPTGVLLNFATEESWIKRFRMGRLIKGSLMHWGPFSRMTDNDLKAIYVYLHTLKPVKNKVFPIVERVKG